MYKYFRKQVSKAIRLSMIAYFENRAVYERTILGLTWIPISTLAFVITLTLVFNTGGYSEAAEFFLYVFIGYSLWVFILDTITQSTTVIQNQIDFANHNRMNIIDLFLRNLFNRFFRFLLNVSALFLTVAFLSIDTVAYSFLAYGPFMLLILLTSFALSYLINFMTLVYPDSEKAIQTVARFLFFVSPVFWIADPGAGGVRGILLTYNPIAYYLSIARQLFFVEPFSADTWGIALIITTITCLASYICYLRTKDFVRNMS